jgi:simple sugar transport system permease protein
MERKNWPWLLSVLLFILSLSSGHELWTSSLSASFLSEGPLIILSFLVSLCLAAGRMDWSIGVTLMFSYQCSLMSFSETQSHLAGWIGGGIAGLIIGIVNGWMIGFLGLHSLIATLGTSLLFQNITVLLQKATTTQLLGEQQTNTWVGAQQTLWGSISIGCGIILSFCILTFSNLKLYACSIGSDPHQFRRWAERPAIIITGIYTLIGLFAGCCGSLLQLAKVSYADVSNTSHLLPLSVLSVCLLSGMSFKGTRPNPLMICFGVISILSLRNIVKGFHYDTEVQATLEAFLLISALIYHHFQQKNYKVSPVSKP